MTSANTPREAGENRFLDEAVRQAQAAVEQKFLFRKIGLPFDYASDPDDFPSKCFATAKEARSNQPNPTGFGAGFHFTCRNHALIFDSYLLRLEAGIEASGDEAILDRLIGGLIRLATVAPKSFLIGGLAPDGRGFYGWTPRENHAAWAFAVTRGLFTAAISPESQEKFRSIAGKWMDRVRREKCRLNSIDGKQTPWGDLSRAEPDAGPFLLAMLLTAARASGDAREYQAYETTAEEESRARMGEFATDAPMADLLWRQAAWSLIAEGDPDETRKGIAKERMRGYAEVAAKRVGDVALWDPSLADVELDIDWRGFRKVPLQESPWGFEAPESWKRLEGEGFLESGLSAAYILLLAGEKGLLEDHAGVVVKCLSGVDWSRMASLGPLVKAIGVHARGVELGLWDEGLYDAKRETPSSEMSFAAKYMEPDYDTANPDKAGHAAPLAPPSRQDGQGGGGAKRRRRKKRR
ncbi:MAG: hypothetical protein LBS30_07835 [Planctomycetota bacterium]|jgi:hypothetical protein|nr:hypothetical protein [Planctomycetota bacterium]